MMGERLTYHNRSAGNNLTIVVRHLPGKALRYPPPHAHSIHTVAYEHRV
jgi:hypothetical protein